MSKMGQVFIREQELKNWEPDPDDSDYCPSLQVITVDGSHEVDITGDVTGIARKLIGPTVRVSVKDERLVMLVQKNGAGENLLATSIAGRVIAGDAILCERRFL